MLTLALILAAPYQEIAGLVYKGTFCKNGYLSTKGYCVKDTQYEFSTSNTLMNDYNKQLEELLVHKLTVKVKSGETPVGDAPVQVTNTGAKQVQILYLDACTGLPKQDILSPCDSVIVETSANGNAAVSFVIDDSTGYVPKLKVAPVWMEDEDTIVDVTDDALDRVSNVNAEQLSKIEGVKQQNIKLVIASLSAMQDFKENSKYKATDDIDHVNDSDVKSADVKKENGFIKVIVNTFKGVVEYVLNTIKSAFRALGWVLKQIGLTLLKVFNAVKAFFAWGDVIRSHQWLEKNILNVREESPKFIKNNEAKTIAGLKKLKGDVGQKVDAIVDQLHGKAPQEMQQLKNPAPQGLYMMNIVSQNAKLLEFTATTDGTLENHLMVLEEQLPKNETRLGRIGEALKNALSAVGSGAKKVSIFIVTAVLRLLQAVFDLFDDIIVLGVKLASIVFYAVTELLWTILTFQITIPFVSSLYAKLTGGSKISLLSLVLLPSAAVATWAFKATHWGKAPFVADEPVNDTDLVTLMKGNNKVDTSSNGLLKRQYFVASFLFFFFSVLIMFVFLEIFIRVLATAILLAVFAPFTFLLIVLVLFILA